MEIWYALYATSLVEKEVKVIKGDYEKLKDLAKYNVCYEHKTPLEVAWYGPEKCWVLRCDTCGYPDGITKQPSLIEGYRQGEEFPEPIETNIKKSIRRRQMEFGNKPFGLTVGGVPGVDLATGEVLPKEAITALVQYAAKYHLDPTRGHVVFMYRNPYITIDGYLYHARQTNRAYSLNAQPMTTDEEKLYKIGATDHGWIAEVVFTEDGSKFTGTGIVTYDEMIARSTRDPEKLRSPVVAAHPWQLAQKRAEWQALRRAFPIGETEEE